MAKPRKTLDMKLTELLVSKGGSPDNIYFQPDANVVLRYPCIIYALGKINNLEASNHTYLIYKRYEVTVISRDPDNDIAEQMVADFDYCFHSRRTVSDGLYHDYLVVYW